MIRKVLHSHCQIRSQYLIAVLILLSSTEAITQTKGKFARPELFETAFLNDTSFIDRSVFDESFIKFRLGSLKIETGKLFICDPGELSHSTPVAYTFPKGNFPAEITIAYYDSSDIRSSDVCYSRIIFSNQPVAKWMLLYNARIDSAHRSQIDYSAITESCVIMDAAARKTVLTLPALKRDSLFVNRFIENYRGPWWKLQKINDHNLVAYAGFGADLYKLYIGLDKKGKIARLLIDGAILARTP